MLSARQIQVLRDALQTLQRHRSRTLLSGLGIVIGVASLSAVLAVGDGLEAYAREQIVSKTDVHHVILSPRTSVRIDDRNVPVREERRLSLTPPELDELRTTLRGLRTSTLVDDGAAEVDLADSSAVPLTVVGTLPGGVGVGGRSIVRGRDFTDEEIATEARVALVTADLADRLRPGAGEFGEIVIEDLAFEVVGVVDEGGRRSAVVVPLPWAARVDLDPSDLTLASTIFVARDLEDVDGILEGVESWLDAHHPQWKEGAQLVAQRGYLVEFKRGILLFKGFMGAITGISLLVGGIGIMNVLLMSVGERTREIGIRRALGARRADVQRQLLAESVLLCAVGAILGATLGISGAAAIAWGLRSTTDAQVHVAVTASSVLFAIGASVVVGLAFGTYPARRAARLSPVEAIRHE